ncbi:transposase [Xenorhabdus thuongxuanensis]|uniref:Transposase n=1 Tax=Xenorhabdus thuongxuanensis TaxID=1873484 RepID=A0A1Q5U8U1_9GAMM|nr:transposase [Xenorhabdus thuongxuanensis]
MRQSRIQILKTDEINELYRRPEFSQVAREEYLLSIRNDLRIAKINYCASSLCCFLLIRFMKFLLLNPWSVLHGIYHE